MLTCSADMSIIGWMYLAVGETVILLHPPLPL